LTPIGVRALPVARMGYISALNDDADRDAPLRTHKKLGFHQILQFSSCAFPALLFDNPFDGSMK